MLDDFMTRALLGGVGAAIAAAPLGCFVVWRKLAYFGDATAHAAILGVALSLAFYLPLFPAVLFVAALMALCVALLSERGHGMDASLGVLSHGALAVGLVAVSLSGNVRVDLMAYLFGDILLIGKSDLGVIWGGGALVLLVLAWRWSRVLTVTLNPDLAHADGINPRAEQLFLTGLLAVFVAVAIKVVGAMLITALLIIPASAARGFARSPESMAVIAAIIGALGAVAGLYGSYFYDVPAGASIVCALALVFAISQLKSLR